jgi:hypothetical protein
MATYHFIETQRPRQAWLWAIMLVSLGLVAWGFVQQVIMGIPWGEDPAPDIVLYFILFIPLTLNVLFFISRLETEVDDTGIHFRYYPFHMKKKTVAWDELEAVYVRKYKPIAEYGGWGLRTAFLRRGTAINMSGNMGVQLVFKTGKRLLIGTNRPEEMRAVIRKFSEKKNIKGEPS